MFLAFKAAVGDRLFRKFFPLHNLASLQKVS